MRRATCDFKNRCGPQLCWNALFYVWLPMTVDEWKNVIAETNAMREMTKMEPLPRLGCSFSGGRTSAVMTKRLWDERQHTHELAIMFANTSCEDDRTLEFVHECETHWGWPVVWLEAVINPRKGMGAGPARTLEGIGRTGCGIVPAKKQLETRGKRIPATKCRYSRDNREDSHCAPANSYGVTLNEKTA